jgi:hypothetical protein
LNRDGNINEEVVIEFEKFIDELKEFFNAMDLDKLLLALANSLEESNTSYAKEVNKRLHEFLEIKNKTHTNLLSCIKHLTTLREALIKLKWSGIDQAFLGYSWNADFQLEDYLFVLLGEFLNSAPSSPTKKDFVLFLDIIFQVLTNMKYSDYERNECDCIKNEIAACIEIFADKPLYYLKVKSSIDRAIRLLRHLSNTIYNAYQSTVSVFISV